MPYRLRSASALLRSLRKVLTTTSPGQQWVRIEMKDDSSKQLSRSMPRVGYGWMTALIMTAESLRRWWLMSV